MEPPKLTRFDGTGLTVVDMAKVIAFPKGEVSSESKKKDTKRLHQPEATEFTTFKGDLS